MKKVLIFGAGATGRRFYEEIKSSAQVVQGDHYSIVIIKPSGKEFVL